MQKYEKQIRQSIRLNKGKLGIKEEIRTIKVSKLGVGENNLSMLAVVNGKNKLVFRIALRRYIEKNMKKEFEYLKIIPKDFGPTPLFFDRSKKILPRVYSVLIFIEGKHINRWSDRHLRMHAKKLAELHRKRYPFCGTIYKKSKRFDLYKAISKEFKEYMKDCPVLLNDPDIKLLVPKLKRYIKENNHLFTSLKRFSMLHSDPCLTNILFTKQGIRYIDWEWLSFGDNARDVTMLFDPYSAQPPWKIRLTGKRLNIYLNTYLKYMKDKTLKQRIDVWIAYLQCTDMLFFKWKLKVYAKEQSKDLSKKQYKKCLNMLLKSAKKRFI
ncbi:aminoglycoside phosphotransferase family protein [Candidatus Woesearchaeota archaeon]|nr:aminoglycoside phosphotransferase family protein [Candidatus Woesearchaeota archaeon]